jgi:hypothetical protein
MDFRWRAYFLILCRAVLTVCGADHRAGELDLGFNAGPLYSEVDYLALGSGKIIGLAVDGTDGIYIGGHFTGFGESSSRGTNWNGLARLSQDGALDASFAVEPFVRPPNGFNHIDAHQIYVTDAATVWAGFGVFSRRFMPDGSSFPFPPVNAIGTRQS